MSVHRWISTACVVLSLGLLIGAAPSQGNATPLLASDIEGESFDGGVTAVPSEINFGAWYSHNDAIPNAVVRFRPTAAESILVSTPQIVGTYEESFSIDRTSNCEGSITVTTPCTVEISFLHNHGIEGVKSASLTLIVAGTEHAASVALRGESRRVLLEVEPSSIDFGVVQSKSLDPPVREFQVRSLSNFGHSWSFQITGKDANQFRLVSSNCPTMIPPLGTCRIGIAFVPLGQAAGRKTALGEFVAGNKVHAIQLTGISLHQAAPSGKIRLRISSKIKRIGARVTVVMVKIRLFNAQKSKKGKLLIEVYSKGHKRATRKTTVTGVSGTTCSTLVFNIPLKGVAGKLRLKAHYFTKVNKYSASSHTHAIR